MSYTIQMVNMLALMNILFNLRLLDILFLYYYYLYVLDKYKYYILCIFYIWFVSLTN
jgi:hypothetical protein